MEFILSPGAASNCPLGKRIIEGRKPGYALADHGYDSDANLQAAGNEGAEPVILLQSNRKNPCDYALYKELRHVECYIGKVFQKDILSFR